MLFWTLGVYETLAADLDYIDCLTDM